VAADVHGTVAALAWSPDPEGVLVPELEVRLPRDAAPVMRGVPRVNPGTPRPAALPLVVLTRPGDGWYAALGIGGRPDVESSELELETGGLAPLLERLADVQRGSFAVAATVARSKVQTLRVGGRR
jgi:gamma-glutamyltranspeptidase/glutathione hydrolase